MTMTQNQEPFVASSETHGLLAAAIPGVRRYIQNFVEPEKRRDPLGASHRGGILVR
jgi:hypothetical protein